MTVRAPEVILREVQTLVDELLQRPGRASVPGLHLSPIECDQLDGIVGIGATRSVETLRVAIERLASLKFGDIRIPFTPGQLAEILHRSQKRGRTVTEEMQAVVARIADELFYKGA